MQAKIKKGFTLIEILLVITLLAILMGIVVLAINPRNLISEVNDNKREADAMTIYQALEQYALKNSAYPSAIVNIPNNSSAYICKTTSTNCTNAFQVNISTNILVPTYMSKIPEYSTDANNSGFYVVKDSNGRIGIGGVKQVNSTTFVKGLESQSFSTVPTSPIVTNGLVLNLDAGNPTSYPGTGTTWTDLSGNGNNGALINGVGFNSANGGSLVFDGVNDYVNIPYLLLSGSQDFTINIWLKSNNHIGGTIFGNYPAGNLQLFHGTNYIGMYLNNASTYLSTPGSEFTTNPVFFTAQRISGNETRVYLNTVLKKTGASTSTIGSVSNFRIGTNTIGTEVYNGNISQVSIYNRALTATEIQQNFNALRGRFGL